jgi:hypothetical protein
MYSGQYICGETALIMTGTSSAIVENVFTNPVSIRQLEKLTRRRGYLLVNPKVQRMRLF